jgi:hypothetical protein
MPPQLFDVFVIGTLEPGPAAEARLAEALARKSGRPAAVIAQALAGKNLRLAHGVAREMADAITREMQGLGAATAVSPHAPGPHAPATPTPVQGFALGHGSTKPGLGPPPVPASAGTGAGAPRFTLTPLGAAAVAPSLRPAAASAPLPPPRPAALPLPEADPPPYDNPSAISSFALPETPPPAPSPFTPDGAGGEPVLELNRSKQPPKQRNAHHTLAGASALNTDKIVATNSASGLTLDDGTDGDMERCPTHGLLFDRRKTRGCRKCLQARKTANQRDTPAGGLRASPGKRAFVGLGFALVLGFAPAAYYATHPAAAEIGKLRAEQTELSQKPGTEEILRRFDELDALVDSRRWHVIGNTAVIWLAASGALMAGFYKVTS